nr:hypothetical protein [Tanacetum cinerariifolium]
TTSFLPFSTTILLLLLLSPTSNAIRISRTSNLMDEGSLGHHKDSSSIHLDNAKESWESTESVTERMNLQNIVRIRYKALWILENFSGACSGTLRNANVKRWSPLYVAQPTNEDDVKRYSIFGYTWAFKNWILESFRVTAIRYFDRYNRYPRVAAWSKKKGTFLGHMVIPFFQGNMLDARLTPDDNEARSDWWISSKAYFDGFIGQVERVTFDLSRQNMYEIPSAIYREFDEQKRGIERNKKEVDNIKEEMRKFRQKMNVHQVRQENKEPIIVEQHYGLSDFSQFQSMQGGPSSFQGHVNILYFNMGLPPNFQTLMSSQPGSSD